MKTITKIIAITVIIVVVVTGLITRRALNNNDKQPRTITAELHSVVQDVTFTGQLEAQKNTQLGFEVPGKIQEVLVGVGEQVTTGQLLARLDTTLAGLELAQTKANQSSAEHEAYLAWQKALTSYNNTKSTNLRALKTKKQSVRDAKTELDQARDVRQQTVRENGDESSTSKSSYSAVLLKETTYHAAQQALEESIKSVNKSTDSAKDSADIAYAQYLATKQSAGNVAGLSSLHASRELAQARLTKTSLTSPFSGVVTAVNKEPGETVTVSETIITIQTVDSLEITANVPESDAAKLSLDMSATITLDAYPTNDSLTARVTKTAPAAVIIEGIPTYKTTLHLNSPIKHLKPGLTANITVHAARRDNVIAVPRRAVINKDNKQIIRVLEQDTQISEREVTVGLLGSDGNLEITSGLTKGDRVVIGSLNEK